MFIVTIISACGDGEWRIPFITFLVTFVGGLQLFCGGINALYEQKLYTEIKKRPIYIAKETEKTERNDK